MLSGFFQSCDCVGVGVMVWGNGQRWFAAAAAGCLLLVGCTQTSRVDGDLSTASLMQTRKAVAVMRVGAASPQCVNVAVLLGVREGEGFRRHQGITVANVRSLTEPAVAEVELDPGEYHVIAYRCQSPNSIKTVHDSDGGQLYRTSYASFVLQPGEVVNVGYLHFGAWRDGLSAFGRPVEVEVRVTDWPLNELDRFKAKRPHVFAQMTTRLMKVTPNGPAEPGAADCARFKELQAQGKVQQLPPACLPAASRRKVGAVAKSDASL
jgi:hypothetical protein